MNIARYCTTGCDGELREGQYGIYWRIRGFFFTNSDRYCLASNYYYGRRRDVFSFPKRNAINLTVRQNANFRRRPIFLITIQRNR